MAQIFPPQELARWVKSVRMASEWSQENLADQAGLSTRTVQRIENGKPSSRDARKSLASGLGYEDLDIFEKPETVRQIIEIFNELDQGVIDALGKMSLPAVRVTSGKCLGRLAEVINAHMFIYEDELSLEASRIFANIADYIKEYGEVSDLCSESESVIQYNQFDDLLSDLSQEGFQIHYAIRNTAMHFNDSVGKLKSLPVKLGYVAALPESQKIKNFLVDKKD